MPLRPYQKDFIDFLVHSDALLFGDFTLKSGRKAPYFVNTGKFDDGEKIKKLGEFYAAHLVNEVKQDVQVVFGPAYKGIPLCISVASALFDKHQKKVGYSFNRKEEKDHGDKGMLVGKQINPGDNVVLVEDVVTAGTTLREILPILREQLKANVVCVCVAVDRCERGQGKISAVQEAEESLHVKVLPIVNVHHIMEYLSASNSSGTIIGGDLLKRMKEYIAEYGA